MLFILLNIIVTTHVLGENYTINYTLCDNKLSWDESREVCETHGGYLVTINSQQVLDHLTTQFDTSLSGELWIGMKVVGNENDCKPYTWHSGEMGRSWENWEHNEPDMCRTDKCVRIKAKKWRTMTCSANYKFICENASKDCKTVQSTVSSRRLDVTPHQSTVHPVSSSSTCCTDKEKEVKCGHVQWDVNNTQPDKALVEQIKLLKQELRVIRNSTKIYLRSKISIYDNRISSATIGIVGILVLIAVFVFPVTIDLIKLIAFVKRMKKQHSQYVADIVSA